MTQKGLEGQQVNTKLVDPRTKKDRRRNAFGKSPGGKGEGIRGRIRARLKWWGKGERKTKKAIREKMFL